MFPCVEVFSIIRNMQVVKWHNVCALLEKRAVTGMFDLSTQLIDEDWPVITMPDVDKMEIFDVL